MGVEMNEHVSIKDGLLWRKAEGIVAGLDIGAVSSKALILLDGQPFAFSQVPTRMPKESCFRLMETIFEKTGLTLNNIHSIVATGRGKDQVPFAHRKVTEISCAAKGALHIWGPSVRTVLDAGGQSCRVIHCTEKGRVTDFLWNDKCAAGIGRSIETFASLTNSTWPQGYPQTMKISLTATLTPGERIKMRGKTYFLPNREGTEIGNTLSPSENLPELSDFCPIYAQSEAFDLIRDNVPVDQVITAFHHAMAKRISTLVGRLGLKKDFVIIGGLAKNLAIVDWIEKFLKINRLIPKTEWDPEYTVALGAALLADELSRRQKTDPST